MSSTRNADGVAVADQYRRDSPLNQRRSTVTCRHSRINFVKLRFIGQERLKGKLDYYD